VSIRRQSTVILSHLHGDHFGGVPFLILDGQFTRRTRPLVVAGPPGVEARVREAMEVFFPPFALRVAGDERIVAYSGDTEWTDSLIDAARGADLFIAEAYFFDKTVRFHLDLATLLRHRARLDCRRLIVTHMNEDMLRRRDALDVETAEDGKVVVV
jgi:ribonuclease BN (tRNA processing enzyme)